MDLSINNFSNPAGRVVDKNRKIWLLIDKNKKWVISKNRRIEKLKIVGIIGKLNYWTEII